MNKNLFMKKLKDNYIQILREFFPKNNGNLSIDTQLDRDLEEQIACLYDAVILLKKARDADDKIATQAALLHISSYAMGLSGFFGDINADAAMLLCCYAAMLLCCLERRNGRKYPKIIRFPNIIIFPINDMQIPA